LLLCFLGVEKMKKMMLAAVALGAVSMSGAASAATTYVGSFQVDQGANNNLGWYSTWGIGGGQQYNENFKVDLGAPGYNAPGGSNSAVSAYVRDNAVGSTYTNYVFRLDRVAGAVPETSTWMMMLAGFGLAGGAMRYRRRRTSVSFG
jgi:hypothetical protein